MKLSVGKWAKIFLVGALLGLSILGFMIKLPSSFRHIDKELHTVFYFLAAAFLNLLFANNKIRRHLLIFVILLVLGVTIEYAQEYSNKFFHAKIHGRYDKEDVQANLKGLIAFSIVWFIYFGFSLLTKRQHLLKSEDINQ
jgi:hypothetical protein